MKSAAQAVWHPAFDHRTHPNLPLPQQARGNHHAFNTAGRTARMIARLSLCLVLAYAATARAAPPTHVTLVQSSQSFNFVPLYIAQTQGYFAQEGLEVEVIL